MCLTRGRVCDSHVLIDEDRIPVGVDGQDLLRSARSDDDPAQRLRRRLRWLETRLRETRRGRALLADPHYANAVRDRLTQDSDPKP